jgi:uncharacterized membrane protein
MRAGVFWLGLALILGGIVHIAAMLVIPALAPKSGYSRFETAIDVNQAVVRGPASPGEEPFPFASPDTVYVVCRYDVSQSPVRFTASLPETYWSLALTEPDGGNYYHINSMQSPTGRPDLVLLGRGQEFETSGDQSVTRASGPRGLMILRIFLRDGTLAPTMREVAARATCTPLQLG